MASKPVMLSGDQIGYAHSWAEVKIILDLLGWQVRSEVTTLGCEGPQAFHLNPGSVFKAEMQRA